MNEMKTIVIAVSQTEVHMLVNEMKNIVVAVSQTEVRM